MNAKARFVLMLEDESERVTRFRAALESIDPSLQLIVWRTAWSMMRECERYFDSAVLISLDHDLYQLEGETDDPGDGLDVAKFLASRSPVCPVIVHSSNAERAQWMIGEFELAGWQFERVAPLGDDWLEAYWRVVAAELIGNSE
jgi:hypothetical protein